VFRKNLKEKHNLLTDRLSKHSLYSTLNGGSKLAVSSKLSVSSNNLSPALRHHLTVGAAGGGKAGDDAALNARLGAYLCFFWH